MLYFITVILLIIGLSRPKSKFILNILVLYMIFLSLNGNVLIEDRIYYELNYNYLSQGIDAFNFEPGYQTISWLFSKIGVGYNIFFIIIWIVCLNLIISTIKMFTKNYTFVYVLYFIYPFIWDTVQIRNFIAMSIVIFGLKYIISTNKNYFKYFLTILIASLFHISSLFYLLFLINKIRNDKIVLIISLFLSVISVFFMDSILGILSNFISINKIEAYTITNTSLFTKIMVISYFSLGLFLVYISTRIIKRSNKMYFLNKLDTNSILNINIISMLGLGLLINNLNFFRLYRNFYIINYILFVNTLFSMKKNGYYYLYYLFILIYVIISFIFLTGYVSKTDIITPVFEIEFKL